MSYTGNIPGCQHFTWEEATKNNTRPVQAVRFANVSLTEKQVADNIINIATWLQRLRNYTAEKEGRARAFIITSWFRPPAVNRAVGGAPLSFHQRGNAVDFYVPGVPLERIIDYMVEIGFPGGIGVNTEAGFIHADLGSRRAFTYGSARDAALVNKINKLRG